MSKIKFIFYLILVFIAYKGFVAFKNFEIGVENRVVEIEEKARVLEADEVIELEVLFVVRMFYLLRIASDILQAVFISYGKSGS